MGQFGGPFENKSEKLWDELYMKTLSLKLLSPILLASKQTTRASNLSLGLDDLIFFNRIFLSNDWMYVYIAIHLFFNVNDALQIGGV